MPRMIDQIRASKLPSGMMQFAARGALQVPAAENIEILVHLAVHNKVFGDLARLTLAGWDEKASRAAAADPQTPREVLDYFIALDNLRPALLPVLLENPSVPASQLVKLAVAAHREAVEVMLKSPRLPSLPSVLEAMKANPYLRKEDAAEIEKLEKLRSGNGTAEKSTVAAGTANNLETPLTPEIAAPPSSGAAVSLSLKTQALDTQEHVTAGSDEHEPGTSTPEHEEAVAAYLKDHAEEITAEGEKPFQSIGGVVELLGSDYFPVSQSEDVAAAEATAESVPAPEAHSTPGAAAAAAPARPKAMTPKKSSAASGPKRENSLQKINSLDVKGRIQLALKGNKEERSLLIRDGTKVVALAVLEAPKLSDGEVEKFASQKNVLEAVLRQIPLKRRFMKNYIVVRNLVANPRTPLDLGLNLMKNLLAQDLKNLSANKEVSETIRKLALKMYKQKMEAANKK
jgi:hypothetical protein